MNRAGRRLGRMALLVVTCAVVAQGTALAADPLRITKPVNATKQDLSPGRTYAAPALAVNPDNPKMIIGGFIEFRTRQCGLIRSTDGGATWKILDSNPAINTQPYCLANNSNIFHAPVAWGRNNTIYLATHAWDETTRTQTSVILARSTNLGDSWTTVFARDARTTKDADLENDRPVTGLYVDTKSGSQDTVYVLYRRAYTNRTSPNAFPQHPVVAISRDGGKTFEEPVSALGNPYADAAVRQQGLSARTTLPGSNTTTTVAGSKQATPDLLENFGASSNGQGITADKDGNIYVTYMSDISNVAGVPRAILVSKSADKGKTWQAVVARPFSYENAQNTRIAWSPGGGSQGTLHVVWEWRNPPTVNTYADVGYIRSTDGGKTWSQPKRIADDDPAKFYPKYLPEIRVAPNGRVDAVWWDFRDDPGIRGMDVYYAYSEDDGETWSKNIRMTDQTIDRRYGVWANNFDQNSPPGLLSTNEYALIAWDDTRFSTGEAGEVQTNNPVTEGVGVGGGVQDIFVSAVQFKALGGGSSKTAKAILAGVVGLLAVGIVLTLMALASRRKAGPAPSKAAKKTAPASVK